MRLVRTSVTLALVALLTACGAGVQSPKSTIRAYAQALRDGKADEAYAMLSDDAKKNMTLANFRELMKKNRQEALDLGNSLGSPGDEPPYVTATIKLANGDVVTMVLEDGKWRVEGSVIEFYSQATPRQAIQGFIRAFSATPRRYDVLLRYTPDTHKEGLTVERLEAAWGEGKVEGQRLKEVVETIKNAMPTATIEETGDRATMVYGSAGTVLFVREQGAWKIEDLR